MKKILIITLSLLLVLTLTGCGKEDVKPNNNQNGGQKEVSGNNWEDIKEGNCVSIIKDKTGIDLGKIGSFTVTNAYGAYTKVGEFTAKYENGTKKADIFEKFVKELLRVSNNSIWSTDVNNETYRIEKSKEYTTYESFLEWKKNGNEDLESTVSGGLYIENYSVNYTFTDTQFNIHISYYVIK